MVLRRYYDARYEKLKDKSFTEIRPALKCAGEVLNLSMGSTAGTNLAKHLEAIVLSWAVHDDSIRVGEPRGEEYTI
eukprot:SAG31_NODE_4531_length_3158_cov_4.651193_1_plen_76_part_00